MGSGRVEWEKDDQPTERERGESRRVLGVAITKALKLSWRLDSEQSSSSSLGPDKRLEIEDDSVATVPWEGETLLGEARSASPGGITLLLSTGRFLDTFARNIPEQLSLHSFSNFSRASWMREAIFGNVKEKVSQEIITGLLTVSQDDSFV